ncbi:hypothetical protein [Desulfobulbus alkaliphilus]|uniref:hypothetical protein n=1 Tax=Desulfobulbus alkaliphilus TaxID=869814 RepID=UPI0019640E93|nr:hypothetical protein [Desulfobulbus alkaliphilus]MBM9536190.1 hypothetical protein [Desulfobulbus alkaliphilus]
MASLIDEMPEKIARLEASHGSDNPFVKDLKRQYAAMKANQGKTAEEVYRMQAVQFPDQQPKASSSSKPQTKEEIDKEVDEKLDAWLNKGIYEAAKNQWTEDSPSEQTDGLDSSTSESTKGSKP